MRKSLLALAALGVYASAVQAESAPSGSSVTLYGIVDASLVYVSDVQVAQAGGWNGRRGKQLYGMTGIGLQQSHFGLRVIEDLGNGLKAVAVLESGLDFNTGSASQGGKLFGRQAFAGLSSPYAGTVTLGRQTDTLGDFVGALQASNRWGPQTAHPGNVDEGVQLNNSVKFTSADYNGFSFGGQYSFGNVPGQFSENRVWTLGARYNFNDQVVLGVGYLRAHHPNRSIYGNNSNDRDKNHIGYADLTGEQGNTVFSGYASASRLEIISAGLNIKPTDKLLLGATYANTKFKNLGDPTSGDLAQTNPRGFTGNVTFDTAEASIDYQLTPALTTGISYSFTRSSNITGTKGARYHQGNLGFKYGFSKRTAAYVIGSFQKASGTDSTALASRANIAGLTPSNSPKQTAVRVGINHKF